MNLRLIGAPKLSDIGPEMLDANSVSLPGESSYMQNCEYPSSGRAAGRLFVLDS
jgi:hypothetical protein